MFVAVIILFFVVRGVGTSIGSGNDDVDDIDLVAESLDAAFVVNCRCRSRLLLRYALHFRFHCNFLPLNALFVDAKYDRRRVVKGCGDDIGFVIVAVAAAVAAASNAAFLEYGDSFL